MRTAFASAVPAFSGDLATDKVIGVAFATPADKRFHGDGLGGAISGRIIFS